MPKKTKKEKEVAKLRREMEALKAQINEKEKEVKTSKKKGKKKGDIRQVDPAYIKKDLLKAGVLTLISFGIIFSLYLFRGSIPYF